MNSSIPRRLPAVALDRRMYLYRTGLDEQFHYIIVLDGRVDEGRLRRAVRLAMDAEPVFGCQYVPGRRPYWQRRDDLDNLPLCELEETLDGERALTEFMARPSDADAAADPLLRVRIIRGSADTLCFKISHVACDGAGGKELMTLIASIYGKLRDDPGYRVPPNLGSRSRMQLFRQYGWKACLRALRSGVGRPAQSQWTFPTVDPNDRSAPKMAIRRLDREQSRALRGYAKRAGATPTAVLATAYFRALWQFLNAPPGCPQTVLLPTNVRDYLASGNTEAICNFTAPLFLSLERIPGEPFATTLHRIAELTKNSEQRRQRALAGALWISVGYRIALPRMQRAIAAFYRRSVESGRTIASLTVNGTFEPILLDFGIPVTDAYQCPPAAFAPGLLLAMSSFRNALSFTIRYYSGSVRSEDVEGFLDAFLAELPREFGY